MKSNDPIYQEKLRTLWNSFINNEDIDYSVVRPVILKSWERSRKAGVNPNEPIDSAIPEEKIPVWMADNLPLIEIAQPYMENLHSLVQGSGFYIQLSDKDGFLLHNIGDDEIMQFGNSKTNVYTSAEISERNVGTSGIGTCVAIKKPIQIWGEEHYYVPHKNFVCSAAPIFDENNILIGTLSASGKPQNVHPHTLAMICSSADAIQKEIRMKKYYESVKSISTQRNLILQSMDTGMILLNKSNRIIHINDAAVHMLNLDLLSLIGKNILDLISFNRTYNSSDDLQLIGTPSTFDEITVYKRNSSGTPKRFQMSVKLLQDSVSDEDCTLISLVAGKTITRLFKNFSGYNSKYTFDSIIGESQVMLTAKEEAKRVASTNLNVLILGASGTGKELFAHAIHSNSSYSSGPFITVNCASLPRELVESELFGYERGAFTGADKNGSPGKFELADKGTIFLDEIGDMPLAVQASVLRVIESREIVRIGGHHPKQIDIRIIAATNKNLGKAVIEHSFREDLYYRLAVSELYIPRLSERTGDVRLLADSFLARNNYGKSLKITERAYEILENYSWPGNVRQLLNAIERAISITDSIEIEPKHLPQDILQGKHISFTMPSEAFPYPQSNVNAAMTNHNVNHHKKPNHDQLIELLTNCHGNITVACDQIGMSRSTFYRHLKKHNIDYTEFRF